MVTPLVIVKLDKELSNSLHKVFYTIIMRRNDNSIFYCPIGPTESLKDTDWSAESLRGGVIHVNFLLFRWQIVTVFFFVKLLHVYHSITYKT